MLANPGKMAALAAALVIVCGTASAQDVKLRYKFKEGDKFGYVMEQAMTMEMSVMGQDIKMATKQVMDIAWQVKSVAEDGKVRMTQTVERIQFDMDAPTGKVKFDSKEDKDPADPIAAALVPTLRTMVGAEVGWNMDGRGQLSDIKFSEKLKESLKNNPAAAQLGDLLSEDGMKKMMSQSGLVLPEEALKKGATWTVPPVETKAGPIGTMIVSSENTYDGRETKDGKSLEKVLLKPKLTLRADPASPVQVMIKSQDAKGTAYFDNGAGRLIETNLTQEVVMEVTAMGQTFAQNLKTTTSLKLRK